MALDKVTTGIIADNAVSTAKVADDAVTGAKIENNPTVAGNLTVAGTSTLTGNVTVTGDIVPSAAFSHRNVIYNGDCRIAQRGVSATNPTSGPNTVDGFRFDSGNAGNATCTQNNVSGTNAPGEFAKSFKVEQTSTVSPGSTAYQQVVRKVEAHDCQQFNATTGTTAMVLSFWVKANYADTFSTAILNIDGVRIVTYEYTTVANEWQKVTHVIPADSGGGSYDDNNDRGVEIRWWLTAGSNYIGAATTSWKANTNNNMNVHSNPAFSTDGREWEITGVQLERGGSATPFEHRSFGEEMQQCKRYYEKSYTQYVYPGASTYIGMDIGGLNNAFANTTSWLSAYVRYSVEKRAVPTVVGYDYSGTSGKMSVSIPGTNINNNQSFGVGDSGTLGFHGYRTSGNSAATTYIHFTADAEIA